MVRIIEGTNLKSLQSIDKWQKERMTKKLEDRGDNMSRFYLYQVRNFYLAVITINYISCQKSLGCRSRSSPDRG